MQQKSRKYHNYLYRVSHFLVPLSWIHHTITNILSWNFYESLTSSFSSSFIWHIKYSERTTDDWTLDNLNVRRSHLHLFAIIHLFQCVLKRAYSHFPTVTNALIWNKCVHKFWLHFLYSLYKNWILQMREKRAVNETVWMGAVMPIPHISCGIKSFLFLLRVMGEIELTKRLIGVKSGNLIFLGEFCLFWGTFSANV